MFDPVGRLNTMLSDGTLYGTRGAVKELKGIIQDLVQDKVLLQEDVKSLRETICERDTDITAITFQNTQLKEQCTALQETKDLTLMSSIDISNTIHKLVNELEYRLP